MAVLSIEDNLFECDELALYFGDDFVVNDYITIHQPTIGEIKNYGESKFFRIVSSLCANPTSCRLELWDAGLDWNKVSEFELFIMQTHNLTPKDTSLIFGDLDFSTFIPLKNEDESYLLVNAYNPDIIIDELLYSKVVSILRDMFDIHPKVERAKGKATKEALIDEERMNRKIQEKQNKDQKSKSYLLPLISSLLNYPGFKYKKSELLEVGIVEFMDSVKRSQLIESTKSLMTGMYMGNIDTSKMNIQIELNWMREM